MPLKDQSPDEFFFASIHNDCCVMCVHGFPVQLLWSCNISRVKPKCLLMLSSSWVFLTCSWFWYSWWFGHCHLPHLATSHSSQLFHTVGPGRRACEVTMDRSLSTSAGCRHTFHWRQPSHVVTHHSKEMGVNSLICRQFENISSFLKVVHSLWSLCLLLCTSVSVQ
jgi:hypothetical protein